jgi:CRISPR-associated endonuclease Csy4
MDHYIDLRIHPDPEFSVTLIMNVVFQKLHLALVDLRSKDIGISFPEFRDQPPTLGACLRLHASANRLRTVLKHPRLAGLKDYLEIGQAAPVPAQVRYRVVSRVQAKSSPERLLRRQMRRHGYASAEEARKAAIASALARHVGMSQSEAVQHVDRVRTLALPYVDLHSQSTAQFFRLFIQHGVVQDTPVAGDFNAYGLSTNATIPWF